MINAEKIADSVNGYANDLQYNPIARGALMWGPAILAGLSAASDPHRDEGLTTLGRAASGFFDGLLGGGAGVIVTTLAAIPVVVITVLITSSNKNLDFYTAQKITNAGFFAALIASIPIGAAFNYQTQSITTAVHSGLQSASENVRGLLYEPMPDQTQPR
jgi:ABC-type amino acid transport system permease subunit